MEPCLVIIDLEFECPIKQKEEQLHLVNWELKHSPDDDYYDDWCPLGSRVSYCLDMIYFCYSKILD